MEQLPASKSGYREVVRPPLWLLAFLLFLTESIALSVWAAFDNRTGAIAFIVALLIVFALSSSMAMTIEVSEGEFKVGRARIELHYLGKIVALDTKEMARVRGRDADPSAFLALRFWQPRGVQIFLQDDRDPTPYWLVTTKRPTELLKALNKN